MALSNMQAWIAFALFMIAEAPQGTLRRVLSRKGTRLDQKARRSNGHHQCGRGTLIDRGIESGECLVPGEKGITQPPSPRSLPGFSHTITTAAQRPRLR